MFKTRLISGIVLVLAALLVIISGGPVLYGALMCVSVIGAGELMRAMKVHGSRYGLLEVTSFLTIIVYYTVLFLGRNDGGRCLPGMADFPVFLGVRYLRLLRGDADWKA